MELQGRDWKPSLLLIVALEVTSTFLCNLQPVFPSTGCEHGSEVSGRALPKLNAGPILNCIIILIVLFLSLLLGGSFVAFSCDEVGG